MVQQEWVIQKYTVCTLQAVLQQTSVEPPPPVLYKKGIGEPIGSCVHLLISTQNLSDPHIEFCEGTCNLATILLVQASAQTQKWFRPRISSSLLLQLLQNPPRNPVLTQATN